MQNYYDIIADLLVKLIQIVPPRKILSTPQFQEVSTNLKLYSIVLNIFEIWYTSRILILNLPYINKTELPNNYVK